MEITMTKILTRLLASFEILNRIRFSAPWTISPPRQG